MIRPTENRPTSSAVRPASGQLGYAYLLALFMIVAMIAASSAIMLNLATQGRRQREEEMIWRGGQYVRAIRLYNRKYGRYPQSLEDLTKATNGIRFLREPYKDSMNREDGTWRLIYVTPSGQLIGSVRWGTLQQMANADLGYTQAPGALQGATIPGFAPAPGASTSPTQGLASGQGQSQGQGQNPPQNAAPGPTGNAPSGPGQNPAPGGPDASIVNGQGPPQAQNPQQGSPDNSQAPGQIPVPGPTSQVAPGLGQPTPIGQTTGQPDAQAGPKPTGPVSGPVIGGFIIGVASSVDKPSLKFYKGGKKYLQWEFIYNPLEELAKNVQQGLSPSGAPAGQQGGILGGILGPPPNQPGQPAPTPPQPSPQQPSQPQQ